MTKSAVYTLPQLTEGTFTNPSLTKVVGVVGASTSVSFNVVNQNAIPANGFLNIELVDSTLRANNTLTCGP